MNYEVITNSIEKTNINVSKHTIIIRCTNRFNLQDRTFPL